MHKDIWNGYKILVHDGKVRCGYNKKDCECKRHTWFQNYDNFKRKYGIEY